ncbi:histidine kinase dimerization/phospho-acceptor domain-containing protein [Paenibacillus sp. B1-33]|uniref:histidine kinase dimerization/phospho-acceptor domain-containing protein n=1 Tax=unclassified Paenibacillus TaxID=185978 RepID=UPI003D27C9F4
MNKGITILFIGAMVTMSVLTSQAYSHELKTPLGIVKGFTEGLQDNVALEKRDRYYQHILSEVDKMNALIMDMMELSRYEARAIQLKRSSYSINEQVRGVVEAFDVQAGRKHCNIAWWTAQEDFRVSADA